MRVTQQVEHRELEIREIEVARIGLAVLEAVHDRTHVLAVVEDNRRTAGLDRRQALVGHDLELHDGLMSRPVELGGLEKPNVVRTPFVSHQAIDVEGRRRRTQSEILRRDDHVEAPARRDQSALALLPLGGIEERAFSDPEVIAGLVARENEPPRGEKAGQVGGRA